MNPFTFIWAWWISILCPMPKQCDFCGKYVNRDPCWMPEQADCCDVERGDTK